MQCPKCDAKEEVEEGSSQLGTLRFAVYNPEYDIGVGYTSECIEKSCDCEFTDEEWAALEKRAIEESIDG